MYAILLHLFQLTRLNQDSVLTIASCPFNDLQGQTCQAYRMVLLKTIRTFKQTQACPGLTLGHVNNIFGHSGNITGPLSIVCTRRASQPKGFIRFSSRLKVGLGSWVSPHTSHIVPFWSSPPLLVWQVSFGLCPYALIT
ncbi:hypothetical protein CTI12_AA412840 [Artemisia annua]|uniref:Uncharacterized protein n=1 Tax=Artemisia annua TaxID=35608 RepID=A0A2U1M764_ARTAN|nr:hypothetical protein CTI12_AA412840 [Artemisia annua]